MCDIHGLFEDYIHRKGIREELLTYQYIDRNGNTFDSPRVDELFSGWNQRMREAQTEEDFTLIIRDIFDWGGVGSDRLKEHYAGKLHGNATSFESPENTPLSSWSKVLAAYTFDLPDNGDNKFYIYDSKVALALNIIDHEHPWYLPEERGHDVVFALIKRSRPRSESAETSYERYCSVLRQQGGTALERRLYMLGKMLDFQCDNWRNCISVDPALVNR